MKKINDNELYLRMNLSYFAEKDEKTEEPSERKKTKAREEGQVAKSPEVSVAFLFLTAFFSLRLFADFIFEQMYEIFQYNFMLVREIEDVFTFSFLVRHISNLFGKILFAVMPLLAVTVVVGVAANIVQVGWKITTKPLMPKFNNLNPISGFKRIFSVKSLITLAKSLAKFAVISYVIYTMLAKEIDNIPSLALMDLFESATYIGNLMINMGINVGVLFLFIALADVFYTRFSHRKGLRMTKQEVKDEYKESEGNPQIKGKIRQKMQEASMRRMMQDLPKADVVITNPTHYAVAIWYDRDSGAEAPVVLAKGVDFLAKKIKEKAKENNVQIVENKQLARSLYSTANVGQQIPPELYQAVAEILAFVYKLKTG